MDFKELGLSEKTIKAISEAGITAPTTVQTDVIPSILSGKDVFTIAPAACGKTCSYVFPLIDIIAPKFNWQWNKMYEELIQLLRFHESEYTQNKKDKIN